MADFTITVSNSLYPLGPDVCTPSLWGTFQWGGKWLFSATDLITDIEKLVTNSLAPSSAELFDVQKAWAESILPDGLVNAEISLDKNVSNDLSMTFETSDETLSSGDWNYVFRKPSTNAENRSTAVFTQNSRPSTTWTSGVVTSTSWSTT